MKPKIAVIYGGFSSEHDISVESGKYVASVIDPNLFEVFHVHITRQNWLVNDKYPIDKTDFSFYDGTDKVKFDAAVIVIHGTPGEDGILQAYFDLIGLPYVGCNHLCSALTFHKFYCNTFLHGLKLVNVAPSALINPGDPVDVDTIANAIGFPLFVKPNAGGSSFGTTKVKDKLELLPAIDRAREQSEQVMAEAFIDGREITVGVLKIDGKIHALTPCEVRSKKEFFDYEAKYNPQLNEEIIPAPIGKEKLEEVKKISEQIYEVLNCSGIVRLDFILRHKNNEFYFLELNSIPGMTSASIVPKMLKYDNFDITQVYTKLISEAMAQ